MDYKLVFKIFKGKPKIDDIKFIPSCKEPKSFWNSNNNKTKTKNAKKKNKNSD